MMVLLSFAELFFHIVLQLIAFKIWETSVVRVAMFMPSLLRRRRCPFYFCITTIIIFILIHSLLAPALPLVRSCTLSLSLTCPLRVLLRYYK